VITDGMGGNHNILVEEDEEEQTQRHDVSNNTEPCYPSSSYEDTGVLGAQNLNKRKAPEVDELNLSYSGAAGYLDKKNNRDRIKQLGAPHAIMQE
jgi:hypothetical protein